jgi:hypothetical protein
VLDDILNAKLFQWLFGSFVVVLYAFDRFENPIPSHGTTTFFRYWVALTGYAMSMFFLYLILAGAFTDVSSILGLLTGTATKKIGNDLRELPGPLFSALLLTSLLPHIPYLKHIDNWVKEGFQRLGNIPLEVRILSKKLYHTRVSFTPELEERLLDTLDSFKIDPNLLYERQNSFKHRWARVVVLYALVRQWESKRNYVRYVEKHENEFKEICRRMDKLQEIDDGTLMKLNYDLTSNDPLQKRLSEELNALQKFLCDFIAGGVLQSAWRPKQRQILLMEMGFEGTNAPIWRLSSHDIFLVGGIIFIIMLFASLLINQNVGSTNLADNLNMRVLFMVPIIYCVSIVAAIYPKAFWSFAEINDNARRPFGGYFVSGLLAVAATFLIQLLFRFSQGGIITMISAGSFTNAFITNLDRWPWLLMTFFTTVAIAWAADDHASKTGEEPWWLRFSETLSMAFIFGLLQWMTIELLVMFTLHPERWFGKEIQMITKSTLVGAVIGFVVPYYYRSRAQVDAASPMERQRVI